MKKLYYLFAFAAVLVFAGVSQAQWFSWESRSGLSGEELGRLGQDMSKRGFAPKKINSVLAGNELRYATIWTRQTENREWLLRAKMTAAENQLQFDAMKAQGFMPVDVTVTSAGGTPVFSGIWEKSSSVRWQSWNDLSKERLEQRTREFASDGLTLTDINAYESAGELRYAAIWSDAGSGKSRYAAGVSEEEFVREIRSLPKGFVPVDVNVLDINNRLTFSAVFLEEDDIDWESRHGFDTPGFQAFFDRKVNDGFSLVGVNSYIQNGAVRYAGIFARQRRANARTAPVFTAAVQNASDVSSTILRIDPVFQQTQVWCWLAIGEMIFKHYDVPSLNRDGNYQCGIIGSIGHNPICSTKCFSNECIIPSGSNYNTVRMLKDYAWISSERVFRADEGYELPLGVIKANIDAGKPIVAGVSPNKRRYYDGAEHVALIVGYETGRGGVSVVINDPFPYSPGANPYAAAHAVSLGDYRYKMPLKDFTQKIFWHWSIYNIDL